MRWSIIGALCAVGVVGGTAHADEEYKRLTLTINAPYLLVPVYLVNAEVAVNERWSAAVRGGGGTTDYLGVERTAVELGAQGVYYVRGTVNRGMQLGIDARYVSFEGDSLLAGLGDGVAAGPFVGYKRVFGSGFTLGGQLGAQVVLHGDSQDPVLPYLAVTAGFSMWPAGDTTATDETVTADAPPEQRDPLDYHRGFMIGFSLGGGSSTCEGCDLQPGIALDASIGWFLHRRVAIMYDSTAMVALFGDDFGAAGVVLDSLAVQYWPHRDVWLKVGVGAARMISTSLFEGEDLSTGGGGTLAVGYEFHHDGPFNMDVQLRATHASFEGDDGDELGVDTFVGLVGFNWY